MRTAALFAIATMLAASAAANPEDWYTPDASFTPEKGKGELWYWDTATGAMGTREITVDENGNPTGENPYTEEEPEAQTAYNAMVAALKAETKNNLQDEQIKTIGKNLDSMYHDNMPMTISIGGYKNTDSTLSITPGKDGGSAKFEITDNIPYTQMVDGRTLNDTGDGRFQLYSANAPADKKVDLLSKVADAGVYLPMLLDGYLRWGEWCGADADVFEYKKRDGYKATRLELRGFKDDEYTMESSTLSKLLTSSDVDSWAKRSEVRIPVRWKVPGNAAGLYYLKIGDVISGLGLPPDGTSVESYVTEGSTNLAIKGWHDGTAKEGVVLADLLTEKKSDSKERPAKEYTVLVREHDNAIGSNTVAYASLGNLYGVTWATNWTEAVEHITKEETVKIVNWVTNWVYHSQFVTNYEDIVRVTTNAVYHESFITNTWNHENFITNVWNHENFITNAITQLNTIVNWQVVTNYIVRYMGGATPGAGGGEVAPPPVDPEDDPYSPEYEEDPVDKYILPVKNARIINAMTNRLFSAVDPGGALDFASLYTNDEHRAEISGFYLAETNQLPIKAEIAPGIYGVDWVDYPEELVKMTSGNIKQIFRWWQQHSGVTNLLANIITNHEALAEMKTNLWSRVKVETLLDNQSVWTNGARRIEVKGFDDAGVCAVPYKHYPTSEDPEGSTTEIRWADVPQGSAGPNFDSTLLSNGIEMKWGRAAPAIKFVGTDTNNFAVVGEGANTNTVAFASAADSNVHVGVAGDGDGNVTITIGVYYLTESALTPPVVE